MWPSVLGVDAARHCKRCVMRERQHKFSVGRGVEFYPDPGMVRHSPAGEYKVTKLLPERNDEFEYRIKSDWKLTERVARESQLKAFR